MTRAKNVITIGVDRESRLSGLFATLRNHGYQVVELPTFEGLFPALNRYPEAVILAYDPGGQSSIRELLQTTSPVIVLVDRSDFDEYLKLMSVGAFDYFALDNDKATADLERFVAWVVDAERKNASDREVKVVVDAKKAFRDSLAAELRDRSLHAAETRVRLAQI